LDYINGGTGDDLLIMGIATTINDISLSNSTGNNTLMVINSGTDEIILANQRHATVANRIETIQFADGFVADLADYQSWTWKNDSANTDNGGSSDDTIIGMAGDDTLTGGAGNDDIHGGADNDTINGNDDNDQIHGGTGDDVLYGDAGDDILFGGDDD